MIRPADENPLKLLTYQAGEQWGWDVSALGVLGYRHGLEPTPEAARRAALQAAVRLLRGWLSEAERELE